MRARIYNAHGILLFMYMLRFILEGIPIICYIHSAHVEYLLGQRTIYN